MEGLKEYLLELLHISNFLSLPDYLVLVSIFLVILLIFLLGVAFRSNSVIFLVLFFFSGVLMLASPFVYQFIMESYLKQIDLTLFHNERLQYDNVYYVEGQFTNIGMLDFKGCVLSVNFIPKGLKKFDRIKYKIRPRYSYTKIYKTPLKKLEPMEFKVVIPSPNPELDFTLVTKGACY